MTQNFVLAFGGTGVRCLEALTYLCASRAIRAPLHVLIVDPDAANGNVSDALSQLQRYHVIQKLLGSERSRSAFFGTPLNAETSSDSFRWQYPAQNQSFGTLIDVNNQSAEHKGLLELLYDDSDLALSFEQGYVGRAHIGSLDLIQTLGKALQQAADQPEEAEAKDPLRIFFRALRSAAQTDKANLLVLGSVFGGTGASGLPAVPPLIRKVLPKLHHRINIGSVLVAPYFTFGEGGEEDPDSALHPLATQAALYHYAYTDVGYNRMYLVGAPQPRETNAENKRGGMDQRNRAHYVELAAALAAAHFIENPPQQPESAEVMASGATRLDWSDLPFANDSELRKNLVSFTTFCMLHGNYLYEDLRDGRHRGSKWNQDLMTELKLPNGLGGQEDGLQQLNFFARRYLQWAEEVQGTTQLQEGGAPLLRVDSGTNTTQLATVNDGGQEGKNAYHELIARLNRTKGLDSRTTGEGWYVQALSEATENFCESHYHGWWKKA
jgi:hypothetical protein